MDRTNLDVLGRFLHRQDEHTDGAQEEHESSEGVVRVSPSSVVACSARRRVTNVSDGSQEVGVAAESCDEHPRNERGDNLSDSPPEGEEGEDVLVSPG